MAFILKRHSKHTGADPFSRSVRHDTVAQFISCAGRNFLSELVIESAEEVPETPNGLPLQAAASDRDQISSVQPDSEPPYSDSIVVRRYGILGVLFTDSEKTADE